jgi:hypothetical protein
VDRDYFARTVQARASIGFFSCVSRVFAASAGTQLNLRPKRAVAWKSFGYNGLADFV